MCSACVGRWRARVSPGEVVDGFVTTNELERRRRFGDFLSKLQVCSCRGATAWPIIRRFATGCRLTHSAFQLKHDGRDAAAARRGDARRGGDARERFAALQGTTADDVAEGRFNGACPPATLLIPSRAHSFSLTQAMLNSMAATAQVTAEKASSTTEELEKKTTKQRRKSRELEDEVFGMSLNDVDKLQKVFNEIDSDGNGYIDTNELKSALQKAGQNPTDEQCKAVLAKFAKELGADKGVLFGEFQKMVAQWDSIEWDK